MGSVRRKIRRSGARARAAFEPVPGANRMLGSAASAAQGEAMKAVETMVRGIVGAEGADPKRCRIAVYQESWGARSVLRLPDGEEVLEWGWTIPALEPSGDAPHEESYTMRFTTRLLGRWAGDPE